MAEKKYPGDPEAVSKLKAKIVEGKGPTVHGVTVCVAHKTISGLLAILQRDRATP